MVGASCVSQTDSANPHNKTAERVTSLRNKEPILPQPAAESPHDSEAVGLSHVRRSPRLRVGQRLQRSGEHFFARIFLARGSDAAGASLGCSLVSGVVAPRNTPTPRSASSGALAETFRVYTSTRRFVEVIHEFNGYNV